MTDIKNHISSPDQAMAANLLDMDTSQGLPLFRPDYVAPPPIPGSIRVKSADAHSFTARPRATDSEPKEKTVIWRHLKNDKIRYSDPGN